MFESWQGVLDTTWSDKGCQWLTTGRWFSLGTPVSFTNKTYLHDVTELLLKVAFNTITPPPEFTWITINPFFISLLLCLFHIVFKQNDIIIFVPVQKDPVDSGTAEYAFVVKPKSNSTGMESKQRGKIYWTEFNLYGYQLVPQWINR